MTDYLRLGIDPGTEKSGIALMEGGEYTRLTAWSLMKLQYFIRRKNEGLIVSIEDVMQIKPTWERSIYALSPSQREKQMLKIAQNVGMVKGTYVQIIKMLEYYDCTFEIVKPLQGTLKKTKHDSALFKKLTGWEGSSSEHSRDAAMLLFRYLK